MGILALAQPPGAAPQPQTKAPVAGSRTGGLGAKGKDRPKSAPRAALAGWASHAFRRAWQDRFWNSGTGGLHGKGGMNLPTNLELNEIPFQPVGQSAV
ncbi:MAG: hypothetical protein WDO18_13505 [Acidobacteriota bacterium]